MSGTATAWLRDFAGTKRARALRSALCCSASTTKGAFSSTWVSDQASNSQHVAIWSSISRPIEKMQGRTILGDRLPTPGKRRTAYQADKVDGTREKISRGSP